MKGQQLTTKEYWDKIWKHVKLPVVIDLQNPVRKKFHELFLRILPKSHKIKILEIGCAPRAWLIYFNTNFGYEVYGIDYSMIGCIKTKENFQSCKVKGNVICASFLNNPLKEGVFDIVFSYGFIEHFTNTTEVLMGHSKLLKKDGILIIVIPNMWGIIGIIQKLVNKDVYYAHKRLSAEDVKNAFERIEMKIVRYGYFGTFNLGVVKWNVKLSKPLGLIAGILNRVTWTILEVLGLSNLESKVLSPYIVVIGRKEK